MIAGILLGAVGARAQSAGADGWHLNGTVGMDLYQTTQQSVFPGSNLFPSETYSTAGGDLRLSSQGYLFNPLFFPFTLTFDGQHASNSLSTTGYHDNLFAGTFSGTFLPQKPYPLRVYYTNTNYAATGNLFDENNSTSTFGVNWALHVPKFPDLYIGYTHSSSNVHMPTSLFDTTYKQDHAYISAQGNWKGWLLGGGFDSYDNNAFLPSALGVSGEFQQSMRAFSGQANRKFWGKKAVFHAETRGQRLNQTFPNEPQSETTEIYASTNLYLQHTKKLSSNYFYTLDRVTSPIGLTPGQSAGVQLLIPPTFLSHYVGGRVTYRATKHIDLYEQVDGQHITPPGQAVEFRESLIESVSGVGLRDRWHDIDLSGEYAGHLQRMGTNYGNHTHVFSNEAHGRATWGDPKNLRMTFYGDYNKFNLVDQINGFTENHRFGAEVQTTWPRGLHWRFMVGRSYVELLNISGNVQQHATDWGAQMEQRHFTLGYSHTLSAGAGALFPVSVGQRTLITVPLPLDELIETPLLNRTMRIDAGNLILRLNRNLDLSGEIRQERDYLAVSNFSFRLLQIHLRYRLGKFTIEGAYGRFINDTISNNVLSGLHTNQYRLRIARDFRIF